MAAPVTHERLLEVLSYDPETGDFTWLISPSTKVPVGVIAGSITAKGYRRIQIDGRRYRAHRLVWFYVYGDWPERDIDHRDLDKLNNRWANLRQATASQNQGNTVVRRASSSGLKGVKWRKSRHTWTAAITCDGQSIHLGTFSSPSEAHEAYAQAAVRLRGEFARF